MAKVNVVLNHGFENLEEVFFCNPDNPTFVDEEDYTEYKMAQELLGEHEITLFDEYTALLEKIYEVTDGEYKIYNEGTHIVMWE